MNHWSMMFKIFDGVEKGYVVELTHASPFFPEVDGEHFEFIRITESGKIYASSSDGMFIHDEVTNQYNKPEEMYNGLQLLDELGILVVEDYTPTFRQFHAELGEEE